MRSRCMSLLPRTSLHSDSEQYLTRYTHKTFFEEYTNFQAHYLSHCGVIPLQSFGSHLRPQPHGLGLKITFYLPFLQEILCLYVNAHFECSY
jgi:hypothetical protein